MSIERIENRTNDRLSYGGNTLQIDPFSGRLVYNRVVPESIAERPLQEVIKMELEKMQNQFIDPFISNQLDELFRRIGSAIKTIAELALAMAGIYPSLDWFLILSGVDLGLKAIKLIVDCIMKYEINVTITEKNKENQEKPGMNDEEQKPEEIPDGRDNECSGPDSENTEEMEELSDAKEASEVLDEDEDTQYEIVDDDGNYITPDGKFCYDYDQYYLRDDWDTYRQVYKDKDEYDFVFAMTRWDRNKHPIILPGLPKDASINPLWPMITKAEEFVFASNDNSEFYTPRPSVDSNNELPAIPDDPDTVPDDGDDFSYDLNGPGDVPPGDDGMVNSEDPPP